jgi:hypothetical protein
MSADRGEAGDPGLAGVPVDSDLTEVRAEAVELVLAGLRAGLDRRGRLDVSTADRGQQALKGHRAALPPQLTLLVRQFLAVRTMPRGLRSRDSDLDEFGDRSVDGGFDRRHGTGGGHGTHGWCALGQAPHWPRSQPFFVPVSSSRSRSVSSRVARESTWTETGLPFTATRTVTGSASATDARPAGSAVSVAGAACAPLANSGAASAAAAPPPSTLRRDTPDPWSPFSSPGFIDSPEIIDHLRTARMGHAGWNSGGGQPIGCPSTLITEVDRFQDLSIPG